MKKFIFMMVAMFATIGMKAQIATENTKLFDNIYVGVVGGGYTNLTFDDMFPLNSAAGIKLGKDLTPAVALEAEGLAFFGNNNFNPFSVNTVVKATNLSGNLVLNWSNILFGYNGMPRTFEVKTNTGLGWLHTWNRSINNFTAKTGIDFAFNLGKVKAHSIVLSPVVYWNLNQRKNATSPIQFNKNNAQIGLELSYIYHFKTSNGTHSFKTYDVGAMIGEIDRLNEELAKKPTVVEKIVEKVVIQETPVTTNAVATVENTTVTVFFAKGSDELTDEAKNILNTIGQDSIVDVEGFASPEGSAVFNQKLSEARAQAVADYLTNRGVKVNSVVGKGVTGLASPRAAVVK